MKKYIAVLLILIFVLTAAGCGSEKNEAKSPFTTPRPAAVTAAPVPTASVAVTEPPVTVPATAPVVTAVPTQTPTADQAVVPTFEPAPTAVPTSAPTTVPTPTPAPATQAHAANPLPAPNGADYVSIYSGVMELYTQAVMYGWDAETCNNAGINPLVSVVGSQLGYCYRDVDGSGIPELFFGPIGSSEIYAGYTIYGGNPAMFLDSWERNMHYLEPDNVFFNVCSNSAFQSGYRIVKLKGNTLEFMFAIIADYSVDEANPWFFTYKDDWNMNNGERKSTQWADTTVAAYTNNYVFLPYLPLQ